MRAWAWAAMCAMMAGAAFGQVLPVTRAVTVNPTNKTMLYPTAEEFGLTNSFLRYLYGDSTISVTRSGTTARLHATVDLTGYLTQAEADMLYRPIGGGEAFMTQAEADLLYQPLGDYALASDLLDYALASNLADYVPVADMPDYLAAYVPTQGPAGSAWAFSMYDDEGGPKEWVDVAGVASIQLSDGGRRISFEEGYFSGGWGAYGPFGFYSDAGSVDAVTFSGVSVDFSAAESVLGLPPSGVSAIEDEETGDVVSGLDVDGSTLTVHRALWPSNFSGISAMGVVVSGEVEAASARIAVPGVVDRGLAVHYDGTNAVFDSEAAGAYAGSPRPLAFRLQGTNRLVVGTGGTTVYGPLSVSDSLGVSGSITLGGGMSAGGSLVIGGDLAVLGTEYAITTVNILTNVYIGVSTTYVYEIRYSTQHTFVVETRSTNVVTTNQTDIYVNIGGNLTLGQDSTLDATNAALIMFPGLVLDPLASNVATGAWDFSDAEVTGLGVSTEADIGQIATSSAQNVVAAWGDDTTIVINGVTSSIGDSPSFTVPTNFVTAEEAGDQASNVFFALSSPAYRTAWTAELSGTEARLWPASNWFWRLNTAAGSVETWSLPVDGREDGEAAFVGLETFRAESNSWAWMSGLTNAPPEVGKTNLFLLHLPVGGDNWTIY